MKKFKKTLAVFLSCVMTLSTCMVSFAKEPETVNETEAMEEAAVVEESEPVAEETATEQEDVLAEVTELATNADAEELEELEIEAGLDDLFKVPYISTYYFNPKPLTTDNIQIPLYLTDYEQSEYLKNDTSKKLDLIYEIDDVKKTISDIPLGDYTLTIGKLSAGMHRLSVQAVDKTTGLKSAKLYNDLWVVTSYDIPLNKIYYMTTNDLTTYKINNKDSKNATDLINTRDGLTKLFADKQAAGYQKIVLLKGTYRINGEEARYNCITIPSHFTVDMNGSTFKLDTISADTSGCIVLMDKVIDAHLENGILEGDRYERQALNLERDGMGEGINTVLMRAGKFCSLDNLTIKNTTGHTIYSEVGMDVFTQRTLSGYTNTAIIDGKEEKSDKYITSSMVDLTSYINWDADDDYFYIGYPGGYRGIRTNSAYVYVSFYDQNQNFLETSVACQFRKIGIPKNAKYVRVTVDDTDTGNQLTIYSRYLLEYSNITNISFENTRTCAIAVTGCNNLLIENNKYTNCANSITPVPVDFEDGWEECQDVYYRHNEVVSKAELTTGTIVDNAGFNHVYENCINHQILVNGRLIGVVFRNMNDETDALTCDLGKYKTNAYARIYDNDCGSVYAICQGDKSTSVTFKVKNSTVRCQKVSNIGVLAEPEKTIYDTCTMIGLTGNKATYRNCTIQPKGSMSDQLYFYDCTFKAVDGSDKITLDLSYALDDKYQKCDADRLFENCKFEGTVTLGGENFHTGVFRNCEFDDVNICVRVDESDGKIMFEDCTINSNATDFITTGPYTYSVNYMNVEFKGCDITHTGANLISFSALPSNNSQILFDGCTINKTTGKLVNWATNYYRADKMDQISVDTIFKNTNVNRSLEVDNAVNSKYARVQFLSDSETVKKNGLYTENGKTYYYKDDVKQTGWQTISSKRYYFSTDGTMATGWQTIGSKRYYFGTNGIMVTGTVEIDGKTYMFDSNGVFVKEVVQETPKKNGILTENGKIYYYIDDVKQTGLKTVDGKKYYFGNDGAAQIGLQNVGGNTYYFGNDGVAKLNMQSIGDKTYYFGGDGIMKRGWLPLSGKSYYFGSDGAMLKGWQTIGTNQYYFGTDGVMVTGTQTIDGKKYEFGSDGVFIKEIVENQPEPEKKNGFVEEAGKTYYYVDDVKQLGWKKISNIWYYFGADGVMGTNKWVATGSDWYYLNEDGTMATNKWLSYKGVWYYFGADGIMLSNKWLSYKGSWYYFGEDGVMLDGKWLSYKGSWYYFGEGGIMLANKWLSYKGSWYYFDADGIMVTSDWVLSGGKWYYFNASGIMVTGKQVINGKTYSFNASGAWIN